jgi:hypothetical protein
METEASKVNKQLVEELQRLNARVTELEGFSDWARGMYNKGHEMMFGKSNDKLTQHDVAMVVATVDKGYTTDGNIFHFQVKSKQGMLVGTLVWNQGDTHNPFDLSIGDQHMQPGNLQLLKKQLEMCCSALKSAPVDLHAYTSAVLRQQASRTAYNL